ncbi:cytochrome C oxidase assembly protein, partial [bacterium CG17_big_fil_post_rev_8_21_14_2_50_64_8]
MIGSLEYSTLQGLWWLLCSIVGALFLCLNFVQGGQSLLWTVPRTAEEKSLFVNSLGLKWELTFTTLVTFGGALFAAFPLFYATSFGGAYWMWILILFTFILQAVSYEFRNKPRNLLGGRTYELFMLINGTLGVLLIGTVVGTFFTGSEFTLDQYNVVAWVSPLRGIEAVFEPFNLGLGLFMVFHARTLGAMYLLNNLDPGSQGDLADRLRRATGINFIVSLPFLMYVLVRLLLMKGHEVRAEGAIVLAPHKYLDN